MSASSGPVSFSCPELRPGTFTTATMPPITIGNCARPDWASSSLASGWSVAPKSTVPAFTCEIPPPDPID